MTARSRTGTSRWPLGLRSAVAMAVPVVAGWAAGDIGAGLIASLGAFTARFGGDRPYVNRGGELLVLAVALSSAVALGSWAAQWAWAGIAMVSGVAVAAVWLCNSLAVGPPGAYVFVVGCAAGVGTAATHLPPWVLGLLVLAGAAVGWLVQMAGAVTGFRRPERRAVLAASEAVAAYIRLAGSAQERAARQRAGAALNRSWTVLVAYQPVPVSASSVVHSLRDANRALHMLFTDTVADVSRGVAPAPDAAEQALRIGRLEPAGSAVASRDTGRIPLMNPPARTVLGRAVSPGSHIRNIMVRVAIGVPLAGSLATLLHIGHSYWAMAAAVLVLHEGADRSRTLRRGGELLLGTWAGLGLAGAIMLVHPHGLWLALLLGALQFCIALAAPRSYTLAAVFITATALTVASAAHSADIGWLLLARGCDVLVGCAVGVAVYLAAVRYQESDRLPEAIARTLDAVADVLPHLAAGDPAALAARDTRRSVQMAAITLTECDEAARSGTSSQREPAQRLESCAIATEQLAYRTIAACWTMERQPDAVAFARTLFGTASVATCVRDLHAFAAAVRGGTDLPNFGSVPPFLVEEIAVLREAFEDAWPPSTGAPDGDVWGDPDGQPGT